MPGSLVSSPHHPMEQEQGDPGSREINWVVIVFFKCPACSLQHGRCLLTQWLEKTCPDWKEAGSLSKHLTLQQFGQFPQGLG